MGTPNSIHTLFDLLLASHSRYYAREAFIYRAAGEEFTVTYEKLFEDVLLLSRQLERRGVSKGDRVMLLSDNRYGWIVTDFALQSLGAISVPRGSDTPSQELEYIVKHSQCRFLIVENEDLLDRHSELIEALDDIKALFVIEAPKKHRLFDRIYSYNDLLEDRTVSDQDLRNFARRRNQLKGSDTVTLIYTSGTTGKPKGVILTHENIMYNVDNLPDLIALSEQDRWLSILPTWHIFERAAEYIALSRGCCIVYSTVKTFAADLEKYRPTLVATVPRLWESLYSKINTALEKQSEKKAKIFRMLVSVSAGYRRNRRILKDQLPRFEVENKVIRLGQKFKAAAKVALLFPVNRLAEKKLSLVQEKFGGRLRMAISGGGSLPAYLDEWIDAIGIRIVNAYGMTECAPGIAGRGLQCDVFGTLGPAFPGTDLRIVDESGATVAAGQEGEVQVRGAQVTPGYYRDDEENKRSFTADGFFRTGDLGKLTLTGELILTGRSKEIIVLASGENIDPTHIEATITMLPFVHDAVLVGQDKKGLGALIVPDMEKLREYVGEKFSHLVSETEDLLQNRQIIDKVKREINRHLNPKKGFKPYERLHNISFLEREFKPGEELTNTLKKKRHVIEKKYREVINKLLK